MLNYLKTLYIVINKPELLTKQVMYVNPKSQKEQYYEEPMVFDDLPDIIKKTGWLILIIFMALGMIA